MCRSCRLYYASCPSVLYRLITQKQEIYKNQNQYNHQWCSQALKSGRAQGICGVQGRSPGRGLGQSPQKPDKYRQLAAGKCFSAQVCCKVCPHLHRNLPPKCLDLCKSHDLTRPGKCWHVPTRGYATDNQK